MKPFCEIIVKEVLPAFRALLAKELMDNYNMTQDKVAKKLGITQAAVSQYRRELRGFRLKQMEKDKEITEMIEKFASRITSDEKMDFITSMEQVCSVCKKIREKDFFSHPHKDLMKC